MHRDPVLHTAGSAAISTAQPLKCFAAVAAVITAVLAVYFGTTASMVDTWLRTETYNHCFLVVPAVLWFVWRARDELAATPVRCWWPGLALLGGAGFVWLLGELASALAPTQWAVVSMVPAAVLTLFGWGWIRVLLFPLAFLFFAVPFGEAFTPTLIDWTADFTVAAISAVGIPVFREGQHFVIPSGRWSVVEACSGIRYLMASVMVGVLYAWTLYRSPVRRMVFIAASFIVPIVANWLRAFMIVMIGHLSGNKLAVGVDHFIYGWVFFGVVIGLLFWVGARWREDEAPSPVNASTIARSASSAYARIAPSQRMFGAVALLVLAWPLVAHSLMSMTDRRPVQPADIQAVGGWTRADDAVTPWTPTLEGPALTQTMSYSQRSANVTTFIGWYRDQRQGHELVNSRNRLVAGNETGKEIARGSKSVLLGSADVTVRTGTVRYEGQRLRVWYWYWMDDRVETSDTRAKLALALDRLLARSDTSAWMAIYTEAETDEDGDRVLQDFLKEMGPAVRAAMIEKAAR